MKLNVPMALTIRDAYRLQHEGSLALAEVERAGARIDVAYLDEQIAATTKKIDDLKQLLKQHEIFQTWMDRFGTKTNLSSRPQLAHVLFDVLKYSSKRTTKLAGRHGAAIEDLEQLDSDFVRMYLRLQKLEKLRSTYLTGIRRNVVDGFLHAFFHLHLVRSFRSSSSEPNLQNIPIRDPEVGGVIRRSFVPRDGHVLVEMDLKQAEVRVGAAYHRDPTMIRYIETNHDMHRDMASECFLLPSDKITKALRMAAKSYFTFAEFYGNSYPFVAKDLWAACERGKLTTADGTPIRDHLRQKGIDRLSDPAARAAKGTFERHIMEVEGSFWHDRFPAYRDWKENWWRQYLKRGWFRTHTGFVCQGIYTQREVCNYPIQSASFHCLLWALIRVVKWLKRNKMRSMVISEIHDSLLLDVHRSELDDVVSKIRHTVEVDLPNAWDWIVVPMEAEIEVGEENWYEKKELR